jgi:hypothetical protein
MNHPSPALDELFPRLTTEELKTAKANFDRYLALTLGIFERLEREGHPQAVTLPAANHPIS